MSLQSLARSYTSLGRAILRFPDAPWEDALSHGQMQSKAWAVQELCLLDHTLGLVYVVGGWLGTLPLLMFESSLRFRRIFSFDIDPSCAPVADQINIEHVIDDWQFKALTADMFAMDYGDCDTIINTSCDHIADFAKWWNRVPNGKLVVLQNNNFVAPDHVNTVASIDEMIIQAPMQTILMHGARRFMKYTRFMLIGIK